MAMYDDFAAKQKRRNRQRLLRSLQGQMTGPVQPANNLIEALAPLSAAWAAGQVQKQADADDQAALGAARQNFADMTAQMFPDQYRGDDTGVESVRADPRRALISALGKSMPADKLSAFSGQLFSLREAEERAKLQRQQQLTDKEADRSHAEKLERIKQQGRRTPRPSPAMKNAARMAVLEEKIKNKTATPVEVRELRHLKDITPVSARQKELAKTDRQLKTSANLLGLTYEQAKIAHADGRLNLGTLKAKDVRAHRERATSTKAFQRKAQRARAVLKKQENPAAIMGLLGGANRLVSNARAFLVGVKNQVSPTGEQQYRKKAIAEDDKIYNLGRDAALMRSLAIDMSFEIAKAQNDGRITQQDFNVAMETLGANTQDPRVFLRVLDQVEALRVDGDREALHNFLGYHGEAYNNAPQAQAPPVTRPAEAPAVAPATERGDVTGPDGKVYTPETIQEFAQRTGKSYEEVIQLLQAGQD